MAAAVVALALSAGPAFAQAGLTPELEAAGQAVQRATQACRDTQTSADAFLAGTYNGALTYALTTVLREAKGKIGNRELHARAISWLKGEDFDQVPQLEGRKESLDRQFLAPIA